MGGNEGSIGADSARKVRASAADLARAMATDNSSTPAVGSRIPRGRPMTRLLTALLIVLLLIPGYGNDD